MSKLLDSSGSARAAAERLRDGLPALGTCAGMILLAHEVLDGRARPAARSTPSTARSAATRTAPSSTRSRRPSRSRGLRGGAVPGRVHPRAGRRAGRRRTSRCSPSTTGRPVLCRSGAVWVSTFHPELSGDLRIHQSFLGHVDCDRGGVDERALEVASIKHKKGAADAARGKLFARLIRQVEVAAQVRRRRSRLQPDAAHEDPEGPRQLGADGHHRARHQARHRRARGRHLRGGHLRGLRPERCRGHRRVPHRQPQPHRRRDQEHLQPQRRLARRAGRGRRGSSSARA